MKKKELQKIKGKKRKIMEHINQKKDQKNMKKIKRLVNK